MRDWWNDEKALDTLRLTVDEYTGILAQLGVEQHGYRGSEHRKYERLSYWKSAVPVMIHRASGTRVVYSVKPHNLSARGIAFLNGVFTHTGTLCEVALERLDHRMNVVPGRIVRCRHVQGKVHEIGVEFNCAISPADFIPNLGSDSSQAASDTSARFAGRLLYVDDAPDQQELAQFLLAELGLEVETASSPTAALEAAGQRFYDAVVTRLSDGTGIELARKLRQGGYPGFIVAVTSGGQGSARDEDIEAQVLAAGADCTAAAPLTVDSLVQIFNGVLPREDAAPEAVEPLVSDHWSNIKMRPLILKFVDRLEGRVSELQRLLLDPQRHAFQAECQQLREAAEGYGFRKIARVVDDLLALTERGLQPEQLKTRLAELSRLCLAARQVRH